MIIANTTRALACACAFACAIALMGCSQGGGSASVAASAGSAAAASAGSAASEGGTASGDASVASAEAARAGSAAAGSAAASGEANIVYAGDVLARDDDTYLVDTRTVEEYEEGHIPGALNASYPKETGGACAAEENAASFRANWSKLDIPKDAHVMLYCRTGVRATSAASALLKDGYTNIDVYEGSWTDWTRDSSRPVEAF